MARKSGPFNFLPKLADQKQFCNTLIYESFETCGKSTALGKKFFSFSFLIFFFFSYFNEEFKCRTSKYVCHLHLFFFLFYCNFFATTHTQKKKKMVRYLILCTRKGTEDWYIKLQNAGRNSMIDSIFLYNFTIEKIIFFG